MKEVRQVADFLQGLNLAVKMLDETAKKISSENEFKKHQKEFMQALNEKNHDEISTASTALYATEGVRAVESMRELRSANIPCLAFANDQDNRILIAVPVQYQEHADRMLDRLNQRHRKSQVDRSSFMRMNLGQPILEHKDLTNEQVHVLGQKLIGSGVGFCVEKNEKDKNPDGTVLKTVLVNAEQSAVVNRAVMEVRMMTKTQTGREELDRAAKQRETIRKTLGQANSDKNKDIFVTDVNTDGWSAMLRVTDSGFYRMENEKQEYLCGTKEPQFASALASEIMKMKHPMTRTFPTKLDGSPTPEEIYSQEEIKIVKERLANEEKENSKETGEILAARILGMTVAKPDTDRTEAIRVLNTQETFSQFCSAVEETGYDRAKPDESIELSELIVRYRKLNLTSKEDEEVLSCARTIYKEYADFSEERVVTQNDLSLDNIRDILDADIDKERGGHDRDEKDPDEKRTGR